MLERQVRWKYQNYVMKRATTEGKNNREAGREQRLMSVVTAGTFEMLEACSEKSNE